MLAKIALSGCGSRSTSHARDTPDHLLAMGLSRELGMGTFPDDSMHTNNTNNTNNISQPNTLALTLQDGQSGLQGGMLNSLQHGLNGHSSHSGHSGHAEPASPPVSTGSEPEIITSEPADTMLLNQLQTEGCDTEWADRIDTLGTSDLCAEFIKHEARVLPAIAATLPVISALVDALVKRIQAGGRVFYVGAGNSGRVAYMDCSELGPTFSADPGLFVALVAGGSHAVVQAREDAEDSEPNGAAALEAMQPTALDAVIGISASGRTPFVLGALRAARNVGALTAGITNCQPSGFGRLGVQYLIVALTGPEFVAGSTRLKAGTAAKQILNMISTIAMVRLGKTYRGLMLDVRVRNHKLRVRGRRILRQVCSAGPAYLLSKAETSSTNAISLSHPHTPAFPISPTSPTSSQLPHRVDLSSPGADAAIDAHIQICNANVKLACAVAVSGLNLASAQERLERVHGRFHEFLALSQPSPFLLAGQDDELVLAIDGGGTNCKVAVAARSGEIAYGEAGACNVNCVTPDELVAQIRTAALRALTNLRNARAGTVFGDNQQCLVPETTFPRFSQVWAGIAGLHYSYNPDALAYRLEALLSVSTRDGSLRLTSDALLLGACVGVDASAQGGLSVIAGTGSVAVALRKTLDGSVVPVSRAGGWGHLLGDHGSAFDIGRRALQAVLEDMELRADEAALLGGDPSQASEEPSVLEKAVLTALGASESAQLLPRILHDADREPKHQIAEVSRVVTALAFPAGDKTPDATARSILEDAASSLVARIKPLAKSRLCTPSSDVLIMSGALLNLAPYRALFMEAWERQGLPAFRKTIVVNSATDWATNYLLRQTSSQTSLTSDHQIGTEDI